MTKYISELFEEFEKLKSRKAKLEFLQEQKDNVMFKAVLQGTFDPNIKWNIGKEFPSYTPDAAPLGLNPTSFLYEIPKCTVFAVGHPKGKGVTPKRMKELLLQVLESMHPSESIIFEQMLKKKLKIN